MIYDFSLHIFDKNPITASLREYFSTNLIFLERLEMQQNITWKAP